MFKFLEWFSASRAPYILFFRKLRFWEMRLDFFAFLRLLGLLYLFNFFWPPFSPFFNLRRCFFRICFFWLWLFGCSLIYLNFYGFFTCFDLMIEGRELIFLRIDFKLFWVSYLIAHLFLRIWLIFGEAIELL